MFLTEILDRCKGFEQRLAALYHHFAMSFRADRDLESFWLGMEEEEKHHAKILAAEKAALAVESDPGYFMPEFSKKCVELDVLLKRAEEKARSGVSKDEAFALALELEQSELKTVYQDLVLMGRMAVKLMARSVDESLSLSTHQEGLLNGIARFVPEGPLRTQAETWLTEQLRYYRPQR